jgi:hypothetical protein
VEGQEFAPELGVKNGCVKGVAVAYGTEHPFVGTLTGELDCDTGKFMGRLKGYYRLFDTDIVYHFEGPTPAQYSPEKQALEMGTWKIVEHMMTMNPPGGSGTWNANWDADENPNPIPDECKALFEEDSKGDSKADAGT